MKTAILFTTHVKSDFVKQQIFKLYEETKHIADFFVLYQSDYPHFKNLVPIEFFPFSVNTLNELGYTPIAKTIVPGSNHFAVLQFYRKHLNYSYYWNIEYDVCFNGNWEFFFKWFMDKKEDFIASHILRYKDQPMWPHWDCMKLTSNLHINKNERIRSFNPIYRISYKALSFLNTFLLQGNAGHHEVLLPTIFYKQHMSLADLGGTGEFSYKSYPNLFYTKDTYRHQKIYTSDSTMRYRPVYKIEEMSIPNMLYHPIK